MIEKRSNDPLVSVIIPVYNVAPYLREAFNSVVQQTYPHLEIIVVDDGSTDGSGAICDEYSSIDPRFIVLHQSHLGVSSARNAALDHASGDYVAFLDPDDAYDRSFVYIMLEAMRQENSDIAVCKYYVIHTSEEMKPDTKYAVLPAAKSGLYNRKAALQSLVMGDINTHVWNKLYRSELWKQIHFPAEQEVSEGVIASFGVFDHSNKVNVIDKPLLFYRKRPGSLTTLFPEKIVFDRMNARQYVEHCIESYIPEVFSEDHLLKYKRGTLRLMFGQFGHLKGQALSLELRNQVITAAEQIGIAKCGLRERIGYYLIRFCPQLYKCLYSIYLPIRRLDKRAAGR